ncbi:unnamed protein product [Protopolystoma xenopodis]|uniref:Uncharacterized protein n=1 Tax=Protopolystoma xenopodis TaxID=117903 RepID=A0A3S5CNX4_9PLAT|nr:unnamed protein product [Protopolystoma xenopodis]
MLEVNSDEDVRLSIDRLPLRRDTVSWYELHCSRCPYPFIFTPKRLGLHLFAELHQSAFEEGLLEGDIKQMVGRFLVFGVKDGSVEEECN